MKKQQQKQWIVVFISPCGAPPIRVGKISERKARSLITTTSPSLVEESIREGLYDALWNVALYREDLAHLIAERVPDQTEAYVIAV